VTDGCRLHRKIVDHVIAVGRGRGVFSVQEDGGGVMNRGNRLRRAALVLALLVLAAIVTAVARSAAKTAISKQLTARSRGGGMGVLMVVSPRCKVAVIDFDAKFSHVTAHRLTVSGVPLCYGKKGTYSWKVTSGKLKLKKIRDACKPEVGLFAGTWSRA
jgi:hypothetical protein